MATVPSAAPYEHCIWVMFCAYPQGKAHMKADGEVTSWSQQHSWAEAMRFSPRQPWECTKHCALEVGQAPLKAINTASAFGASLISTNLLVTACKNVFKPIPQLTSLQVLFFMFLVHRKNSISLFSPVAFSSKPDGHNEHEKMFNWH